MSFATSDPASSEGAASNDSVDCCLGLAGGGFRDVVDATDCSVSCVSVALDTVSFFGGAGGLICGFLKAVSSLVLSELGLEVSFELAPSTLISFGARSFSSVDSAEVRLGGGGGFRTSLAIVFDKAAAVAGKDDG
jgi:hypothetical protein